MFNLLEEGRTVILVNPQHMKAVPGRKTDIKDSEWLADLLRHGLLKASFIPPAPIRELRELTRYRKSFVEERTSEINRLHKVLEGVNIKLTSVLTDVLGVSGRAMLEAVASGEEEIETLALLAKGRLRAKLPQLRRALDGRVQPHHRFLIAQILTHLDFLTESIEQVQAEIEQRLRTSYQEEEQLLLTIPSIKVTSAATIISEIGVDMSRFPTEKHLASWAGVCPGNKQSGGKRFSGATTNGNPYLRAALAEVVWSITRTDTYLAAQYHRIARRKGKKRAVMAVAHSLLVIIYHVLREKKSYTELGADYFDRLNTEQVQRHHVRRLEQLGYKVELSPASVA
ncbi:MAG TPA: IS110 family transposase [Ktedonobacteraceae bacterium]|nr:IS110 family transposase [Ktedonobacteraceae bacterium]